ncbi:MAG: hypothetical protein N3I35_13805 [Clostridia bacterium]|nr:hypothetical protein [Clostridia bacterium]
MALLEISDKKVPSIEIIVNSVPLQIPEVKSVLDVSVSQYMSPPNYFKLSLFDPELKMLDREKGILREGSRIEINMGYAGNLKKMLVGEIAAVTADFSNDAAVTIQIEGYDLLHRLSRGTFFRKFEGATDDSGLPDSEIVSMIASEMKLVPSVDSTQQRNEARVQNHVSNLVFLEELARMNGFYIWMDGDTLNFKKTPPQAEPIQLKWGANLISFSARLSISGLVNEIEVRGWEQVQKQAFSAKVQRPDDSTAEFSREGQTLISQGSGGVSGMVLWNTQISSQQEAKEYAETAMTQQRQVITGSGACIGQPDMRAGSQLEISSIGRFEGTYTVQEVRHTYGPGGYLTFFQVGRML